MNKEYTETSQMNIQEGLDGVGGGGWIGITANTKMLGH